MANKHNGIVSAGHEMTAEVAVEVLRAGGNAFDAAVAALLVSFNAEPCMSSPGGGGFANICTADGRQFVLDFFCQTPARKRQPENCDFYPFTIQFGEAEESFHIGHGSHAVPGMMAGIFEMHRRWGSMPMATLAQPAIAAAKQGVPLDEFQHMDICFLENMIATNPEAWRMYYPDDKPLAVGQPLRMPELAGFLDGIVHEGPREFYEGEIARQVSEASEMAGGHIARGDFEAYKAEWISAVRVEYGDKTICLPALPSLGGLVLALGLAELSTEKGSPGPVGSLAHQRRVLRALRKLEHTRRHPEVLFDAMKNYGTVSFTKKWGSTTHFNIMDAEGNALAVTVSNGEGSGYLIPGTDCFMNNMLGEAALLPEGFYSWQTNTRLHSLMSPTIVLDENQRACVITGTGGAGRIPGAILQLLHYVLDHRLPVAEALAAPRMHLVGETINFEPGFEPQKDWDGLKAAHWEQQHMYFGGVHTITYLDGHWDAAGDARRYGVARLA